MKLLQRLPANHLGRDFVCGDIHGSYSCVERFLKEISFDKEKDRLICAGDLIDRGPDNENCLMMLLEPWFFCVKGNHEFLMEKFFANEFTQVSWYDNGGFWGRQYHSEDSDLAIAIRGIVEDKFKEMPLVMTVEKADGGIFHVLHAELWADEPISDEIMADEYQLSQIALRTSYNGEFILWGRRMFVALHNSPINEHIIAKHKRRAELEKLNVMFSDKLSHIYSGHTPMRGPVRFYGQTNLDTAAYNSYIRDSWQPKCPDWCGLTFTEPATDKFWTVSDHQFKEVSPHVII